MRLPYEVDPDDPKSPPMGIIVLQTDETIEPEFARYFADHPSRERALMFGIVKEVIRRLEHPHPAAQPLHPLP